ncbi:MAG: glycosyltransferase family 9 protein [Proteobacteria bacterium]|nr:glycosyltransferase family 9 protein [Pseudomonadota bacterium]
MHPASEKILVIKHGALGDVMQSMDGFASVRAGHPTAHISVLTTPPYEALLSASPYFNAVLLDTRAPVWNLLAWWRLRAMLKHGDWTRVYDFQCSQRTATYFRIYFKDKQKACDFIGKAKGTSHRLPDLTGLTTSQRGLAVAKRGGCAPSTPKFDWLTKSPHPLPAKPYAVFAAGSSPIKPSKRWSPDHYASVAEAVWQQGIRPILVGTTSEAEVAEAILARAPFCLSLLGKTDLFGLAKLFHHAEFTLGNDTGPMFIAARMPSPSLTLMGGDTDPLLSAPAGTRAHWLKTDDLKTLTPERVLKRLAEIGGLK